MGTGLGQPHATLGPVGLSNAVDIIVCAVKSRLRESQGASHPGAHRSLPGKTSRKGEGAGRGDSQKGLGSRWGAGSQKGWVHPVLCPRSWERSSGSSSSFLPLPLAALPPIAPSFSLLPPPHPPPSPSLLCFSPSSLLSLTPLLPFALPPSLPSLPLPPPLSPSSLFPSSSRPPSPSSPSSRLIRRARGAGPISGSISRGRRQPGR